MARQLIGHALDIELPPLHDCVRCDENGHEDLVEWFTVTEGRRVRIVDVVVESSFSGFSVDILGRIADYTFVVYLTHPGRTVPDMLRHPSDRRTGVLAIALDRIAEAFSEARSRGQSYQEVLVDFLAKDLRGKQWIFHPGYDAARAEAAAVLDARPRRFPVRASSKRFPRAVEVRPLLTSPPTNRAEYKCVICNALWEAWHGGGTADCPACHARLCGRLNRLL
jgi:hypothetical protein